MVPRTVAAMIASFAIESARYGTLARSRSCSLARAIGCSRADCALAPPLEDRDERLGADGQRACLVVDHVEVAMDGETSQTSALKPIGLEFPAHGVDRHERDSEAGH